MMSSAAGSSASTYQDAVLSGLSAPALFGRFALCKPKGSLVLNSQDWFAEKVGLLLPFHRDVWFLLFDDLHSARAFYSFHSAMGNSANRATAHSQSNAPAADNNNNSNNNNPAIRKSLSSAAIRKSLSKSLSKPLLSPVQLGSAGFSATGATVALNLTELLWTNSPSTNPKALNPASGEPFGFDLVFRTMELTLVESIVFDDRELAASTQQLQQV